MTSNVIAQLVSTEGESAGPQLDLPHDITTEQLETLLNDLLKIVRSCLFVKYLLRLNLSTYHVQSYRHSNVDFRSRFVALVETDIASLCRNIYTMMTVHSLYRLNSSHSAFNACALTL